MNQTMEERHTMFEQSKFVVSYDVYRDRFQTFKDGRRGMQTIYVPKPILDADS